MKLSWYFSAFVTFRLVTSFKFKKARYENKTGAKFVVLILPFFEVTFIDCSVAKKILVAEFFDKRSYIENLAQYEGEVFENHNREMKRLEERYDEIYRKKAEVEKELSDIKSSIHYSKEYIHKLWETMNKVCISKLPE